MEQQTQGKATFPPFAQQIYDRGKLEGFRDGELKGKREALLRLLARVGIALTKEERTRIEACDDSAQLDRWLDNALGAKTASDVLA